ncbi:MAG: phage portal protein [Phenylobacterium zucineum]|nr:MAG: phage portal protein [Phenylobacterium zucineum]
MNPLQLVPREGPTLVGKRAYTGAQFGRLLSDWVASSTSQDAESRMAIRVLRNRVRDLGRNNDYVVNALRAIQNNTIGQGVALQAQVKRKRGPGSGKLDLDVNQAIETAWQRWKRADSCHTAGVLSFPEIERLLVRNVAESGEIFVRMIRRNFGRSPVPLALEIIEADLLDENYNGESAEGNQIRMGVEVNEWFRPVAYHFFTQHPGDIQFGSVGNVAQRRIRVPASEVIHLFTTDRPGQTRGIPWFASALTRLRHMTGYEEATVIAARASACQMGFIETPDPEFEGDGVMAGERVSQFEPGRITTLAPGEKFTAFNPTQPSGLLDPFMRYMLRGVSAGAGVSYETLSKDYSQSNYSSSRLALLDDRDTWRQLQQWIISTFHQRVFEQWLQQAVLSNVLNLPSYETQPELYEDVRWLPRGWQWIDPSKEITAYKTAVRSGFMTVTDVVAQNGGDFEELAHTRQREVELCKELDLVFDTDPALVDMKGQEQPSEQPQPDPADPASSGQGGGKAQDVVA